MSGSVASRGRLGLRAAALLPLLLAAGCGSTGNGGDQADSNPAPVSITVAVPALPSTLDPALATSASARAIAVAIHTPLLTYRRTSDADSATLEPALAREMPTLTAGDTEYDFTLRPGLLYADGQVVTASDVERAISHASVHAADPELRSVLDEIVGAPSKDGQTLPGVITDDRSGAVVIKLRHPDSRLPLALADPATAPMAALPSSNIKELPTASTGPLRVARVTGSTIDLISNPLRARIATVPAARATRITITSRATTAATMTSGAIDVDLVPGPGPLAKGITSVDASSGAVWSLLLDPTGPLAGRTVRGAIAEAVDRRNVAADANPHAASAETSTTPSARANASVDLDLTGGLAPACGLLPAYVVGAVIRDDCPPAPSYAKPMPLAGVRLRLAFDPRNVGDRVTAAVVATAIGKLGGSVSVGESSDPAKQVARHIAQLAIVHAAPNLPHPAGWLAPAELVDTLIAREVPRDQATPLTGSSDRWSALEQRAVQRAIVVPLAVGRSEVLVNSTVERGSVLLHPVLGLDLTALSLH